MNSSTPAAPSAEAALAWVRAFAEGWRAPASAEAFANHFEPWFDPYIRLIQPQLPTLGTLRPATVRAHPRPGRAGGALRDRRRLRLRRADPTRHPWRASHLLAGVRPGHSARGVGGRAGELLRSDAAASGHPHPPPSLAGTFPRMAAIPTSPNRTTDDYDAATDRRRWTVRPHCHRADTCGDNRPLAADSRRHAAAHETG
jgi:hypothetical protein